jgi:hypothetical protein
MGSKLEKIGCIESGFIDDGRFINYTLIDSNNDLNLTSIQINNDAIFDSGNFDKQLLQKIINTFEPIVNKFIVLIDWGESGSTYSYDNFYNSIPKFDLILETFEENKIIERLVWRSNGINPPFKSPIKFEPISTFLGVDIGDCFDIEKRRFSKHFLSLYRGYKPIREHFHNFLRDNNLLEKTLFSYNSEGSNNPNYTNNYSVSIEQKNVTAPMLMKIGEYYKDTFCSIVYEALWEMQVVFFTEKINKCLLAGHPFIIVSTPKYLYFLKKLGFKTFNMWWDESYDNEYNHKIRREKIEKVIKFISELTITQCEQMYEEMIPTLKHNQRILKKISKNRILNNYSLVEFDNELI